MAKTTTSAPRIHQGIGGNKIPLDKFISQFDVPGMSPAAQKAAAVSFQAGLNGAPVKVQTVKTIKGVF